MVGESSDANLDKTTLDHVAAYHALPKVNVQPFASTIAPASINCYVAGDAANYRLIHPEKKGANVTVARGTTIVREVLDANGQVAKLTVMAKGPAGYDPSLGDWLFGVTDPQGVPLVDNGVELLGRLTQCHDCHRERQTDDFLFGVPGNDTN